MQGETELPGAKHLCELVIFRGILTGRCARGVSIDVLFTLRAGDVQVVETMTGPWLPSCLRWDYVYTARGNRGLSRAENV